MTAPRKSNSITIIESGAYIAASGEAVSLLASTGFHDQHCTLVPLEPFWPEARSIHDTLHNVYACGYDAIHYIFISRNELETGAPFLQLLSLVSKGIGVVSDSSAGHISLQIPGVRKESQFVAGRSLTIYKHPEGSANRYRYLDVLKDKCTWRFDTTALSELLWGNDVTSHYFFAALKSVLDPFEEHRIALAFQSPDLRIADLKYLHEAWATKSIISAAGEANLTKHDLECFQQMLAPSPDLNIKALKQLHAKLEQLHSRNCTLNRLTPIGLLFLLLDQCLLIATKRHESLNASILSLTSPDVLLFWMAFYAVKTSCPVRIERATLTASSSSKLASIYELLLALGRQELDKRIECLADSLLVSGGSTKANVLWLDYLSSIEDAMSCKGNDITTTLSTFPNTMKKCVNSEHTLVARIKKLLRSKHIKRVVIWGYKRHHTHHYIHKSFFEAFKRIGVEVIWQEDRDEADCASYAGAQLFLTMENSPSITNKLPIRERDYYLVHRGECAAKYLERVGLENILFFYEFRGDPEHYVLSEFAQAELLNAATPTNLKSASVPHSRYFFYTPALRQATITWGTNLFPSEIMAHYRRSLDALYSRRRSKNILWVGSVWDGLHAGNLAMFSNFVNVCRRRDLTLHQYGGFVSPIAAALCGGEGLVLNSLPVSDQASAVLSKCVRAAPAFQGDDQIGFGPMTGKTHRSYLPCRLLKNISYGVLGITNNTFLADCGIPHIVIDNSIDGALEAHDGYLFSSLYSDILYDQMTHVASNYTYLHIILYLLTCLVGEARSRPQAQVERLARRIAGIFD